MRYADRLAEYGRQRAERETAGLGLFEQPRARATDPDTSHQAAESMADAAARHRDAILILLGERGPMTAAGLDVEPDGGAAPLQGRGGEVESGHAAPSRPAR